MKTHTDINPLTLRIVAFLVLLLAVVGIFSYLTPSYLTNANMHALLRHMAVHGLMALGLTFVIVVLQFDLSFPGTASLGAMTMGWLIAAQYGLGASIACAVAVGLLVGLVNGVAVAYLNLPNIVATIAMGGITYGLSYFYSDGTSISENFFSSGILDINDASILHIDAPVLILGAFSLLAALVLHASRLGCAFYATGENRISASYSGIKTRHYILAAFAICGVMSCVCIVLQVASSGAANVTLGSQLMMPAYAAVYLGSALFNKPSVPATLAGSLLIAAMLNGFTLLAIPYYYSDAITSLVLILAVAAFNPRLTQWFRHAWRSFQRTGAARA